MFWEFRHLFHLFSNCSIGFQSAWSINHWVPGKTHHFSSFRIFSICFPIFHLFSRFSIGFQRFPDFDLGVSLLPRFFFPWWVRLRPTWPSVAARPPRETLHAAQGSANANATYTACMGAYAWGLICLCGVSTLSIFLHPENKCDKWYWSTQCDPEKCDTWTWSTQMWPLQ